MNRIPSMGWIIICLFTANVVLSVVNEDLGEFLGWGMALMYATLYYLGCSFMKSPDRNIDNGR